MASFSSKSDKNEEFLYKTLGAALTKAQYFNSSLFEYQRDLRWLTMTVKSFCPVLFIRVQGIHIICKKTQHINFVNKLVARDSKVIPNM